MAKKYDIACEYIKITPLGLVAKIENINLLPRYKKILITLAGVLANLFLFIVTYFLPYNDYIFLFKIFNLMLVLFNLLPIYPLDGGRLLTYCMEKNMVI